MIQEKSVGAVVFYRGKEILYLLLHHKTDYWNFPKGNVEQQETEDATARREILEETGLTVEFVSGFRETVHWIYTRDGQKVSKDVVFFLAEAKKQDVIISFEHEGFVWLNYDDAMKKLRFPTAKKVLEKAHQFFG